MKKTIATAVIAAAGFIGLATASANAQPALCDNHGTGPGQIYITACAVGGGNGGSYMWVRDPVAGPGHWKKLKQQDVIVKGAS